jgi:hypothetical protein
VAGWFVLNQSKCSTPDHLPHHGSCWVDQPTSVATWEVLEEFKEAYPKFQLEDKLFQQEGGNVMDRYFSKQYKRKTRKGKEAISG